MRKILAFILSFVLIGTALVGCSSSKKSEPKKEVVEKEQVKDNKKDEEEKEQLYELDTERYKVYLEAVRDIIEYDRWPDGEPFSEYEGMYSYMGDNGFAIYDIDMDGSLELLVENTAASMAGMVMRVFDYDEESSVFVEQWRSFPAVSFYDNGVLYVEASHNHSGSEEIWPFDLYQYNKENDTYENIGYVEAVEREYAREMYNAADDKDGDGIVYYIAESGTTFADATPCTKDEYEAWREKYLGGANLIHIPWYSIRTESLEMIENAIAIEGAVCPISLPIGQSVTQYDLDSDGKKDTIEISCNYTDEYPLANNWSILINGENALDLDPNDTVILELQLYRVSDKRTYITINRNEYYNGAISGYCMYKVENNKLVEVLNPYSYAEKNVNVSYLNTSIKYMTANEIQIDGSNQFNATAYLGWSMQYQYDKKTDSWEVSNEEMEIIDSEWWPEKNDGMTAHTAFTTYKSYDSDEVAYEVNVGDVLVIEAIRFYEGKTYFKATNGANEVGWFVDPDSIPSGPNYMQGYFEESQFAG